MMSAPAEKPSPHVEVVPATLEQQPILANLLQLYAHDFSEFHDVDLGPDGRFVYASLPLYWSEPDRHPFLVRVDGRLAGFVLVKRGSEVSGDKTAWDMAEFFVIRGCRRRGIGTQIARDAVQCFGLRLLGACDLEIHGHRHTSRSHCERWGTLESLLV